MSVEFLKTTGFLLRKIRAMLFYMKGGARK